MRELFSWMKSFCFLSLAFDVMKQTQGGMVCMCMYVLSRT